MFVAESVLSDVHVKDATIGIQLVNSSLVMRNCTMNGGGGIQLTGSEPVSLTLDNASFSTHHSVNTITANLLDELDLSVTNSHLSAYGNYQSVNVRCRGHLSIRITNSTMKSTWGKAVVVQAYDDAIRVTIAAENSTFTGEVHIIRLRHLVCFLGLLLSVIVLASI